MGVTQGQATTDAFAMSLPSGVQAVWDLAQALSSGRLARAALRSRSLVRELRQRRFDIVIDAQGRVAGKFEGIIAMDEVDDVLAQVLEG